MNRFLFILWILFAASACTKKKVDIEKEKEKTNYEKLSGGVLLVTKHYPHPLFSFYGWFFQEKPSTEFDTGQSTDIGTLTINNSGTEKEPYLPAGIRFNNEGNITGPILKFAIKTETGEDQEILSLDGTHFPEFSNPHELPNEISRSTGFKFTLKNMVRTASVTVTIGPKLQKTFTDSVIHFSPEELASLSQTSYAVLEMFLSSGTTVNHQQGGKEFYCTYQTRCEKRGFEIR